MYRSKATFTLQAQIFVTLTLKQIRLQLWKFFKSLSYCFLIRVPLVHNEWTDQNFYMCISSHHHQQQLMSFYLTLLTDMGHLLLRKKQQNRGS